ncbi:hypothetical protein ABWI00_07040 [Algihabitans albus]|uniref:hypothetical protein n=1 Tax=Algihabitans albus TaxID=2164067 RepID=UPI0035CF0107
MLQAGAVFSLIFAALRWLLLIDFSQYPLALSIKGVAVRLLAALIVDHVALSLALLLRH